MKKYIGTKLIKAEPLDKDGLQGYKVVYSQPDGSEYTSWSPKDVFEKSYREVNGMSFGLAIEAAKLGLKIARTGWNGKNMFVVYMPPLHLPPFNTQEPGPRVNDRTAKFIGEDTSLDCQPYFAMFNAQKQWIPGWVASQSDMLADDWQIIK